VIIEAITLITTANAAIGAVKEFVANGRDLMDCGKELGQYFDAKSQLQKQANPSGSPAVTSKHSLRLRSLNNKKKNSRK
jgi:hypothetical protein